MITSMTGFGRSRQIIGGQEITVEVKSVNHRYFEFSSRIPRQYGYLESKLKKHVSQSISRGKVEISITIFPTEGTNEQLRLNKPLAAAYLAALREFGKESGLKDDITLCNVLKFQDVFFVKNLDEDDELIWTNVKKVADEAIKAFVRMRQSEGEKMMQDIVQRLAFAENFANEVERLSEATVVSYRERLIEKIQEVLHDSQIKEERILTEAAIYAEKIATDEETVRLKSHIKQFEDILESKEPVGRKLDFLVQEINREVNTIGSKCNDLEITKLVVGMKSEIEKIREQIQNIE